MRFKITISVVLLAITLSVCGAGVCSAYVQDRDVTGVDESLTVMTFNVRTLNLDIKGNPNDDITLRTPLMLKQIAEADPDLIGMQEWLFAHEGDFLKGLQKNYGFIAVSRDGTIFGEKCAIFYKLERFELIDSYTYWISETPEVRSYGWDSSLYRICTTAVLKDLKSGKILRLSNVHLDHEGYEARKYGTELVVDNTADSEYPAILLGDFNYDTTHENYQYCIERLDDCRLVAPGAVTTVSYNGWKDEYLEIGGYPIDHIFVSKGDFKVYSYQVLNRKVDGLFTSDHFPIVVKLEIK